MLFLEEHFRALGTSLDIIVFSNDDEGSRRALLSAREKIEKFECRFSRFLPDSELAALNRAEGVPFHASAPMLALLEAAAYYHRETNGVFDPTVIGALETFGYRASIDFEAGPAQTDSFDASDHRSRFAARHPFTEMRINRDTNTITLPAGMRVDLGGIGKGFIVDRITEQLAAQYKDFWISAGGDVRMAGTNAGLPWSVTVQNPLDLEGNIGYVTMRDDALRACATSGIGKRRGNAGDIAWHHIVNPVTGMPAESDIVAATVLARDTMTADVFAKTALILGARNGIAFIDRHPETACLLVKRDGSILLSREMRGRFTLTV